MIKVYKDIFRDGFTQKHKLVIRCKTRGQIEAITKTIKSMDIDVIGIHEKFSDYNKSGDKEDWERKRVPDPDKENAVVWGTSKQINRRD
ncbi:MAG: hypothetical protein MZV64_02835 [Ignavibacteriales bacterium]|nr:hypothetical protein [Ignavibacteriales bacterium]